MVGIHYTKADWNNRAYQLRQIYLQFCELAEQMAAEVAPYDAAGLAALTGFTTQEATDLISGVNVADKLRQVSIVNGTPDAGLCATASQAQVALGKFGGA